MSYQNEVIKNKSELKVKNDELRNISEELKIRHSKTIEMELKCRKLTLAMNKKNTRTVQDMEDDATRDSLTEDQVNQRIAEIDYLGYEKRQEEKKYGKLIKQVEGKIKNVEHDREIWFYEKNIFQGLNYFPEAVQLIFLFPSVVTEYLP